MNKILLVDDEIFNLSSLMMVLKYKLQIDVDSICVQALSGEQALEIIKKDVLENQGKDSSFKLILMDYSMPTQTGPETCILIREFLYKNDIE